VVNELIAKLIERPASCWSADTREIHDAIWPFCQTQKLVRILTTIRSENALAYANISQASAISLPQS